MYEMINNFFWYIIHIYSWDLPNDTSLLVKVMAWYQLNNNPLLEPMIIKIADALCWYYTIC